MSASKINVATPVTPCADLAARTPSADTQTTYRRVTWLNGLPANRSGIVQVTDELAIGRYRKTAMGMLMARPANAVVRVGR
jgi:hypothetical protein